MQTLLLLWETATLLLFSQYVSSWWWSWSIWSSCCKRGSCPHCLISHSHPPNGHHASSEPFWSFTGKKGPQSKSGLLSVIDWDSLSHSSLLLSQAVSRTFTCSLLKVPLAISGLYLLNSEQTAPIPVKYWEEDTITCAPRKYLTCNTWTPFYIFFPNVFFLKYLISQITLKSITYFQMWHD